jgi:hypothetical protein
MRLDFRGTILVAVGALLAWSLLPSGLAGAAPDTVAGKPTNAAFTGIGCASVSDCEAVGGWTYQSEPEDGRLLAEHWNGAKWTVQAPRIPMERPMRTWRRSPAQAQSYALPLDSLVESWNGSNRDHHCGSCAVAPHRRPCPAHLHLLTKRLVSGGPSAWTSVGTHSFLAFTMQQETVR